MPSIGTRYGNTLVWLWSPTVEPDAEEELTVAGNGKSRSQNNNIEQNLRKRKSSGI